MEVKINLRSVTTVEYTYGSGGKADRNIYGWAISTRE
jgi:hypothetical protein